MKKRHWGGVLIELVIVIVGVFIGLQVNKRWPPLAFHHSSYRDAILHHHASASEIIFMVRST